MWTSVIIVEVSWKMAVPPRTRQKMHMHLSAEKRASAAPAPYTLPHLKPYPKKNAFTTVIVSYFIFTITFEFYHHVQKLIFTAVCGYLTVNTQLIRQFRFLPSKCILMVDRHLNIGSTKLLWVHVATAIWLRVFTFHATNTAQIAIILDPASL